MTRNVPREPAPRRPRVRCWGFTLIELMVVVAVVAIVLVLAVPSFRDLIEMRRLRGAVAQLVTDVQFARTEAASRQELVGVAFNQDVAAGSPSCYMIYTLGTATPDTAPCNCMAAAGARCAPPMREVRTVQIETATALRMVPVQTNGSTPMSAWFTFDPSTGGLTSHHVIGLVLTVPPPSGEVWVNTSLTSPGSMRSLRTVINTAGRPKNCLPSGSAVTGVAAC